MKYAIVDFRVSEEEIYNLKSLGLQIIFCHRCNKVYEAICGHPDIQMHIINPKEIVVHKDINPKFLNILREKKIKVYLSKNELNSKYPKDIILNAVTIADIFIHNISNTDDTLKDLVKDKKNLNVKQGYTKCSTAIVSDKAVMTSDLGIRNELIREGFDVLLLPPGHIDLPHLNYGFIGGSCGLIEAGKLAFFGDINCYKYKKEVLNFLIKHDVKPIYLKNGPLMDRGSLFVI